MSLDGTLKKTLVGTNNEVREMAMAALALLGHDEKKLHQQAKQLIKVNNPLAQKIFTTEIEGWTPIHACAQKGSKKLLKTMLESGVDINCGMGQPEGLPGRCTLLHIAANRGHTKVLEYLISHGANVNATDTYGRTPLFYANRAFKKDSITRLLDNGAKVTDPTVNTQTIDFNDCQTPEPRLTNFCFFLKKS